MRSRPLAREKREQLERTHEKCVKQLLSTLATRMRGHRSYDDECTTRVRDLRNHGCRAVRKALKTNGMRYTIGPRLLGLVLPRVWKIGIVYGG